VFFSETTEKLAFLLKKFQEENEFFSVCPALASGLFYPPKTIKRRKSHDTG
jgi:uncharacterized protein YbbK (DUF523 family)